MTEIEILKDHLKLLMEQRERLIDRAHLTADMLKSKSEHIISLMAETERLKMALQKILDYDRRSMYERCPDCEERNDECTSVKRCKICPVSTAGEIALLALGSDAK